MRGLLLVFVFLLSTACSRAPSVAIDDELLVGKQDGDVMAFLGVLYAEPPLGELRWREPQTPATKMKRRDATQFAPACMQTMRILDWYRNMAETFGGSRDYYPDLEISEDCLYLNVWTPTLDNNANLPVMVWLHGGSNISGWSYERNYHGQSLADKGVVVVSVGFRVGLFGFMSHPDLDPSAPVANFGLWDIVAALRWIQTNIDRFGGDPGRVTLLGESSGAHSVVMLMAADPARGLFHRAIGQSTGGYGLEMSTLAEVQKQGTDLATAMGFTGDGALKKLRASSPHELLARYVEDVSSEYQNPSLDGVLFGKNPWERFTAGEFRDIPLIIGTNADEWWDYIDPDSTEDDVVRAANELSHIDSHVALQAIADETLPREAIDRLKNAEGYVCPSQALAAAMSAAGHAAWMYYFTRIREDAGGEKVRAYHGAEYPYVFNTHDPFMRTTDTDVALTKAMQQYWISFATTGDPNSDALPEWPRFAAPDFPVLELGDKVRTVAAPEPDLCAAFRGALNIGD